MKHSIYSTGTNAEYKQKLIKKAKWLMFLKLAKIWIYQERVLTSTRIDFKTA